MQSAKHGWDFLRNMNDTITGAEVSFSELDLSTEERYLLFKGLGMEYSLRFDDSLHAQFATSLQEAYDLARQTQELGLALETSTQITPLFYAIIDQMEQLYNFIGDRSS